MDRHLVIVRHGEYGSGNRSSLTEGGLKQMQNLKKAIDGFFEKVFGDKPPKRICFSFSNYPRAVQSIQELVYDCEDIILTELFMTDRNRIYEPEKIFEKVTDIAQYYGADIVVIVAHGQMPAVLTETAHELATRKKLAELPYVGNACGYITNLNTGEVVPIRYDDLDAKPALQPTAQESSRPIKKGGPRRDTGVVKKGGPYDTDDIPF